MLFKVAVMPALAIFVGGASAAAIKLETRTTDFGAGSLDGVLGGGGGGGGSLNGILGGGSGRCGNTGWGNFLCASSLGTVGCSGGCGGNKGYRPPQGYPPVYPPNQGYPPYQGYPPVYPPNQGYPPNQSYPTN